MLKLNCMWAINSILELIFPERADHKIVRQTSVTDFIKLYQPNQTDKLTFLTSFQEPCVRATIHETKFHHNEKAILLLAELLKIYLSKQNQEAILIPIPLSPIRERERGYNQVTEVAKLAIKNNSSISLLDNILQKTIHTVPQTSLNKTERMKNNQDAYSLNESAYNKIVGQHIILIDDVLTTGSTLKAAKSALLQAKPASVVCVALAH